MTWAQAIHETWQQMLRERWRLWCLGAALLALGGLLAFASYDAWSGDWLRAIGTTAIALATVHLTIYSLAPRNPAVFARFGIPGIMFAILAMLVILGLALQPLI
jgi:hypothetical protein